MCFCFNFFLRDRAEKTHSNITQKGREVPIEREGTLEKLVVSLSSK